MSRRANPVFQLLRGFSAGNLDQDTVVALTLDRRLTCARSVNTATNNFQRLFDHTIIRGQLFSLREPDADHLPLSRDSDVRCARARQGRHRLAQTTHQFQRAFHASGLGNTHAQRVSGGLFAGHKPNGVTFCSQHITHLRPHRVERGAISLLNLHFGEQMRTAPQVQPEVHQIRRQERRPERDIRRDLVGTHPRINQFYRVVVRLDAAVKKVRQGKDNPGQAGQ